VVWGKDDGGDFILILPKSAVFIGEDDAECGSYMLYVIERQHSHMTGKSFERGEDGFNLVRDLYMCVKNSHEKNSRLLADIEDCMEGIEVTSKINS
jgi:hypothetical protein